MPYLGQRRPSPRSSSTPAARRRARPSRARVLLEACRDPAAQHGAAGGRTPRPAPPAAQGTYVDAVVHLTAQLADALAFIHARGVCHRDLKPSNILLDTTGRPRLLDFNLSADDRYQDVRAGGTLPYMAPEQLRRLTGDPPPPTPAADLFSLGVLGYELLAGAGTPFGNLPPQLPGGELLGHLLRLRQDRGPRPLHGTTRRSTAASPNY